MSRKIYILTATTLFFLSTSVAWATCPGNSVSGQHTSPDNVYDFEATDGGKATIVKMPLRDGTWEGLSSISCVGDNVIIEVDAAHADYYCAGKFTSARSFYLSCDITGTDGTVGPGHIDATFD